MTDSEIGVTRLRWLATSSSTSVAADILTALETRTCSLIDRYELDGPNLLVSEALARRLFNQLATRGLLQRADLGERITAQLEALLAYIAVGPEALRRD